MKRTRLSRKKIGPLRDHDPNSGHWVQIGKPHGLWYEVDGGWKGWLESEQPDWLSEYKYLYKVDLRDANVLALRTVKQLDQFHAQFGIEPEWRKLLNENAEDDIKTIWRGNRLRYERHMFLQRQPDWTAVAAAGYDGIEIAPYIWARRLDYLWYYGWDCASGVLWRPRNARLTLIKEKPNDRAAAKSDPTPA